MTDTTIETLIERIEENMVNNVSGTVIVDYEQLKALRALTAENERLGAEVKRLKSANEHWYSRMKYLDP